MTTEPTILIEHRAALHYLLTEAAEIEHGLMCCYLYAAFSLKSGEADGLSAREAAAVARMRATVIDVARDEMVHLALVCNVLSATGGGPHLMRQNFPVGPGYHPAGVIVSLAPFDRATLEHFLFLERPEGVELADGSGFAPTRSYARSQLAGRLVPSAQDYATVGHLYRGIRAGLEALTAKWGAARVFCGDPRLQLGPPVLMMNGLTAVTDLPSALRAIDTIVTQGEGAPGHAEGSHYQRYLELDRELAACEAANPAFVPAHAAARNPVMRRPPVPEGKVWIDREPAAGLLDIGNAIYELMLRLLNGLFGLATAHADVRAALVDGAIDAMHALATVASYLPRLPATADDAGPRAGLTFTMSRAPHALPDAVRGLRLTAEYARAIVANLERIAVPLDARFVATRDALARLAGTFDALAARDLAAVAPVDAPPTAPAPSAGVDQSTLPSGSAAGRGQAPPGDEPALPSGSAAGRGQAPPGDEPALPSGSAAGRGQAPPVEIVTGKAIEISFEGARCIHSRHCVLETPEVFLANVKGPWIHPDAAPLDRLIHVARSCPSGAITYRRLDGGPDEDLPPVNQVKTRERGPLAVLADLRIAGQPARLRATLCRCGASKLKPFCDGSHTAAGFDASGEPATTLSEPLATRRGPLEVTPLANGPLRVRGPLEVLSGTGRTVTRLMLAKLCRCGGSANKPFCDGTHARIGFIADGE